MFCTVVAEFLLTSASRGPSAIAEPLVELKWDRNRRQHVAVQSFIYEVDLAYQPDGRLAVDASASGACDIPDKGSRPCGGWKNPAGTVLSFSTRESSLMVSATPIFFSIGSGVLGF